MSDFSIPQIRYYLEQNGWTALGVMDGTYYYGPRDKKYIMPQVRIPTSKENEQYDTHIKLTLETLEHHEERDREAIVADIQDSSVGGNL